ncbi:MAG: CDP-alcohol phosphatidyltransferase family protein [Alphaproteobacteria bacterium]|nr:CDP-alcohol phosphatidyltransferase family protein [Alphaproteobacteria bacterium]
MSLYRLKSRFQALLRPATSALARRGVTANQVTLSAALGSVLVGGIIAANATTRWLFALIPLWFLVRMALNAIDGMLAREFNQSSSLGAYLNEISDVVSDAALYLPFALVAPFGALWVGIVIFLSALSEFVGVLGPAVGASRRYDGPMGKSDRALVFGALGLTVAIVASLPQWLAWVMPAMALLLCLTIVNRVRAGLRESRGPCPS